MKDKKTRNSFPNRFAEDKKARNFVPNYSTEDKNARNFVPNHSTEDKNARNSVPNHYAEEKSTLGISFRTIKRKKKVLELAMCSHDAFFYLRNEKFFVFMFF
jgi:hypothetical protein